MSCEAPVILKTMLRKVMAKMAFLSFKTIVLLREGIEKRDRFCFPGAVFFSNMSTVGKTIKEISSENVIPALIIQPKLIIGLICENSRDEKPAMVVRIAKKVGVAFESMVSNIILCDEAFG